MYDKKKRGHEKELTLVAKGLKEKGL